MRQDCNRCDAGMKCRGKKHFDDNCKNFRPPYDKWKLAELVLAHPTGLNVALSALPFETSIDIYLDRRG